MAQGIELSMVGIYDTEITSNGIVNQGEILRQRDLVINRYKLGNIKMRKTKVCRNLMISLQKIPLMPGLEGIEKTSDVNIAEKNIDTIRGDFSNEQK